MAKMTKAVRDKRNVILGVRITPAERAAIERAAAREYRRMSDYVRVLVLRALYERSDEQRQESPDA